MSQFITYNKSLSISIYLLLVPFLWRTLIHLGYVLYVFSPEVRGKGLFMGLSKESELQNGMGLRNHMVNSLLLLFLF